MKSFGELIKKAECPFFPTSKRKREEFLSKVREKVAFYKPKIEERCKISLGNVLVKDNKEWLSDLIVNFANKEALKYAWGQARVPTQSDYKLKHSIASIAEMLMVIPLFIFNNYRGADMRQYNGTIYIPFYYMNRVNDINFEKRTKYIDYTVVHELSHTLWEKISGDYDGGGLPFSLARQIFEGFATYCADDYFADFYPNCTKYYSVLPRVYSQGKEKIEEFVEKYGKEVILEIPKNWRRFSI